jgi:hypothetical protein
MVTPFQRRPTPLSLAAVLVLAGLASVAQAGVTVRSGHAGHWFVPERSGEGWVLEMLDARTAWLYWFTYDEQGGQRWMTATGQVVDGPDGQAIEFPQLVATRGARFGAGFDPADVIREDVGSARLVFVDCEHGRFSYDAFGQQQTFPVLRLARVLGTRCEAPHGYTGRDEGVFSGTSGSFYDPAHNGEGFAVHWTSADLAILTWYSYDSEGNPYWMLGTGQRDSEGIIRFDDLHATRGARFGAAFEDDDVERFAWGHVEFNADCLGGSAAYESVLPDFGSGGFSLARLTGLFETACMWHPTVRALTDLHDLSLQVLPAAIEALPANSFQVQRVTVDAEGGLWASTPVDGAQRVIHLAPGAGSWMLVGELRQLLSHRVWVADADIFATGSLDGTHLPLPMRWRAGAWTPAAAGIPPNSVLTGVGPDGRLLGATAGATGVAAWQYKGARGLLKLPAPDDSAGTGELLPRFASTDGGLVIGSHADIGVLEPRETRVWRGPSAPHLVAGGAGHALEGAAAAGRDGRVVFGAGTSAGRRPWYWLADHDHAAFIDGAPAGTRFRIGGASADGNLLAGSLQKPAAGSGAESWEAFVWTPFTGLVELRAPINGLEPEVAAWQDLAVLGVSADGRRVVIGDHPDSVNGGAGRLALLRLTPRNW